MGSLLTERQPRSAPAGRQPAPGLPGSLRPVALYAAAVDEMPRNHRPAKSVRVLLAEDPRRARGALALLLGLEPDLEVVAQVGAGAGIADAALVHRPDVVLLDLDLPDGSCWTAAAELRRQVPDCRVLVLATSGRPEHLRRALEAGAAGFLVKDGPVDDLTSAIRRVLTGETVIDPALGSG